MLEVPGVATLEQQLPASCHQSLSSNFAGDYSFLAPLSVTSSAPVTPRKSVSKTYYLTPDGKYIVVEIVFYVM